MTSSREGRAHPNHWVATAWRAWARWTVPGGASLEASLHPVGEETGAWLADSAGGGSLVSWWEGDRLRSGVVVDAGALLARLRPADVARGRTYMDPVAPVTVRRAGEDLQISLFTDLWFPRVLGLLDGWEDDDLRPPLAFDNAALAEQHTPRLDAFLRRARSLAADAGLEWTLEEPEGAARPYSRFTREDGIDWVG